MNLSLPKYDCILFRVSGQSRVSDDQDERLRSLMSATHSHSDPDLLPRVALFGSKYTDEGVASKAEGMLLRRQEGDEVTCSFEITYEKSDVTLSRPPRDYKPMSALIDGAVSCLGVVAVRCHAVFEYPKSGKYASKVHLPVPLVFPDAGGGASHIEGVEFSLRDGDRVDFRVLVSNSDDRDLIAHTIHFDGETGLDRKGLRSLRDRSRAISTRLLSAREENGNGTVVGSPMGL
jgi:hypothetical protein